jgi:serine/threonine protein kinase
MIALFCSSRTAGFAELGKLKNLKVLDMGDCGIDLPENEFFNFVLPHLKKLSKLEYINFSGNPIQTTIREFRYFAIQELPRVKYLNWELIAKEDRSFASELATSGTWDNKTKSIALHSTNSMSHLPRPTPKDPEGTVERHLKQGTYATSRLEELLAAEEAKAAAASSSNPGGSSVGSSNELEDLDKILDMVSGGGSKLPPTSSTTSTSTTTPPPTTMTASASVKSTVSVMDELDALLSDVAGYPTSSIHNQPAGGRGSYANVLDGMLLDDDLLLTGTTTKTPSPGPPSASASGSSISSLSSSTGGTSRKPADPLDELDSLLASMESPTTTTTTTTTSKPIAVVSSRPQNSTTMVASASNPSLAALQKESTPPPPSRGTSLALIDPLDDILGQLEAQTSTASTTITTASPTITTSSSPSDSSAPPRLSNRANNKPRSTIFEDLESEIFEIESDHSARTSTKSPLSPIGGGSSPSPSPSPSVSSSIVNGSAASPHFPDKSSRATSSTALPLSKVSAANPVVADIGLLPSASAPNTARSSAVAAMSNNSDLDSLERDILAMQNASYAPSPSKTTASAVGGVTGGSKTIDSSPVIHSPVPVSTGSGLAALANFTTNISTSQFDSLLDSFDSASAKALSTPSLVLPQATASPSPPISQRSLQRGPRPSTATPMATSKLTVSPWEIPADDLVFDFLLGKGIWGETFEGGWKYEHDSSKSMQVSLKRLLNKDFTPESVASFKSETKDLLEVKHEHLVPLLGCSVRDSKVILWKGVNGAPLWGYLRNPTTVVTPREILQWAKQLAAALVYLHSQHIIHGGVKTSNIIIDKEHRLVTKDFGFMDYKDEVPLLESDPRYLAPELISGRESGYNEKIDVYGFGMVVYEMMMRESPFVNLKPAEIIDMMTHRIIHPETVPGIFPPVFIRLLAACWSHDPIDRPSMDKVLKILESNPDNILGDYADIHLEVPAPKAASSGRTIQNAMAPRPSEPPKPVNLPQLSSPSLTTKVTTRAPAASVGSLQASPSGSSIPAAPSRPSLRVAKPIAIKPLLTEELNLEVEQERKLVALLSKLQEMLSSGNPEMQSRALNTLVDVVKDEKRINYVANRSLITRDLVELIRANSIDTINSWRYEYPHAFETIELVLKTTATLSATDAMASAFMKHGMMELLVEFVTRAVDPLKILAAQAVYELCLTEEGRSAIRKAAGISGLIVMLKTKNEFVQSQAAWTLSSVLDDEINQEDFITAGGLEHLSSMLNATNNAALRLRVLDALSNFWASEKAREILVTATIKDKFLQMLSSNAQMLQSTALRGIGKFSRHPTFQPSEVESLKILKTAMDVVQGTGNFIRDRLNAIQICDNLTKDKTMLTNFRDMGGMSMMVKCIGDAQPEIRCAAIHVLSRALSDERSRDAIVALGAVAPLISQLASSDSQVRIRTMAAVDVLRKFPRGQTALIANAGVSRIVSIVAFSEDPHEQVLALQLLDVFSDNLDHKEDVREAGGLTAILQSLPTLTPEGKLWACTNIGHLCSTEKNRQALVEQKGVSPLIVTVHGMIRVAEHSFSQRSPGETFVPEDKLVTVVNTVLNGIFNMSEIAEFRTALRDADAAQFACDMLASNAEAIQIHALRALTGLATDPKNKVVIRTGAAKRLKEFALGSTNTFLAQSSNQVLVLIDAK